MNFYPDCVKIRTMRALRLTYPGAMHYIKLCGQPGEDIFLINRDKVNFLDIMKRNAIILDIRVFAYCIMNNDIQMVVENTSGSLGDFLENLSCEYGIEYRKANGGTGGVIHDRDFSVLIQDNDYLKLAISFVLLTPLRENLVETAEEFLWSSAVAYFEQKESELVDVEFVRRLYGRKLKIFHSHHPQLPSSLPIIDDNAGQFLGEDSFPAQVQEKLIQTFETQNAAQNPDNTSPGRSISSPLSRPQ